MSRTLAIYILREVVFYTLLAGVAVTLLFLGGNASRYATDLAILGFDWTDFRGLLVPVMGIVATYTVPIAFLFAVLSVAARMTSDGEVLALSSCGLGRRALLFPVVGLGLVVSLTTACLVNFVEHRARQEMRHVARDLATRATQFEPGRFRTVAGRVVYVRDRLEDGVLEGVMISDHTDRRRPLLILAEFGRFDFQEDSRTLSFELTDGEVHVEQPTHSNAHQRLSFEDMRYSFDLSRSFLVGLDNLRPYDMSNSDLRGILEVSDRGGSLKRYVVQEPVAYELEVQRRWAIPVAPVLFAAVGVPLGIRGKRGARSWGALSCTLVALSYYVISTFGRQLAEQGWVSPVLAMWSPNVLLALVAVLLLRERETFE